jgi:excisionase family DNA binding protein
MPTLNPQATERFLTRQQAAEFLGLKPQTLANWAITQRYLPVVKIGGRCVRYRMSDLLQHMEQNTIPTSSK